MALNLDILDAGRLPNVFRVHARTTQGDFEVDRLPPADSPPGDLLINNESLRMKIATRGIANELNRMMSTIT